MTTEGMEQIKHHYHYRCDFGDVNCDYTVEHEDMEEVRNQARVHRLAEHRQEDFDPLLWDPMIETERAGTQA